ncbi:MAG: replication initiation factor [Pseudomonadota bacterium]
MSTDNTQAGSNGSPGNNKQADPDSPDGCEAPPAESGSEGIQGASPSNTAPHNSNNTLPDGFRLLRLAVDSLYLSYPGDLHPGVLTRLTELKGKAQSPDPVEQAKAQFVAGNHIFEVKDKGAGLFPFVLDDNAFRIQFSRPNKKLPMAYVKISAEYLAHKGPRPIQEELEKLLAEFGELTGRNMVSRIDLAADFSSPCVMDSWHRSAWVTRAVEIHSYAKDQQFTGWTIGMGGVIAARLYDKTKEIRHSGKSWAESLWIPAGWLPGQQVWRLEFECKRDYLKERGLSSLDSVLVNLNGLWSYATTEWLRLTEPNPNDSTRARWPTHPLWTALASVDWETSGGVLLKRFSNARLPDEKRLYGTVFSSLASYMAIHQLDDKNVAIDGLLGDMHQHFQGLAYNQGLEVDELLAQRIAARSRLFNSGVNYQEAQEPEESEGVKAYRKASRGD